MWHTEALQRSLDGIDGHGIRPVLRPSPPAAAAPIEMARVDRRQPPHPRHRSELASAAARAALDRIDLAIVLLHPDRRVLLSNSAALRAQARGDCFHIRAQKLHLADRQCQHALDAFLAKGATTPRRPMGRYALPAATMVRAAISCSPNGCNFRLPAMASPQCRSTSRDWRIRWILTCSAGSTGSHGWSLHWS